MSSPEPAIPFLGAEPSAAIEALPTGIYRLQCRESADAPWTTIRVDRSPLDSEQVDHLHVKHRQLWPQLQYRIVEVVEQVRQVKCD